MKERKKGNCRDRTWAKAHRISNKPHNLDLGAVHLQSGYGNQLRTFHPCKRSEKDFS